MKNTTAMFNYARLRQTVYDYKEKYPFAGYSVCARSWGGRALFTLSLGNRQNAALFVSGFSADDTASVQILLKFFDSLCKAYSVGEKISGIKTNDIFKTKGIAIIPCANPDGMEIRSAGAVAAGCYAGLVERVSGGDISDWCSNSRGVDINHNFSTGWKALRNMQTDNGIDSPSPKFYGGKTPQSEPETRALVKMCRSRDVRHTVVLRNGERSMFMKAGEKEPERADMMAKIFASSSGCPQRDNTGSLENCCGLLDWFASEFGRPAFSFQADGDPDRLYSQLEEVLVLSSIM